MPFSNIYVNFQQNFRYFVRILLHEPDGYTTSVKPVFSHSYAVFGSIAWMERKVKFEKNKVTLN